MGGYLSRPLGFTPHPRKWETGQRLLSRLRLLFGKLNVAAQVQLCAVGVEDVQAAVMQEPNMLPMHVVQRHIGLTVKFFVETMDEENLPPGSVLFPRELIFKSVSKRPHPVGTALSWPRRVVRYKPKPFEFRRGVGMAAPTPRSCESSWFRAPIQLDS